MAKPIGNEHPLSLCDLLCFSKGSSLRSVWDSAFIMESVTKLSMRTARKYLSSLSETQKLVSKAFPEGTITSGTRVEALMHISAPWGSFQECT